MDIKIKSLISITNKIYEQYCKVKKENILDAYCDSDVLKSKMHKHNIEVIYEDIHRNNPNYIFEVAKEILKRRGEETYEDVVEYLCQQMDEDNNVFDEVLPRIKGLAKDINREVYTDKLVYEDQYESVHPVFELVCILYYIGFKKIICVIPSFTKNNKLSLHKVKEYLLDKSVKDKEENRKKKIHIPSLMGHDTAVIYMNSQGLFPVFKYEDTDSDSRSYSLEGSESDESCEAQAEEANYGYYSAQKKHLNNTLTTDQFRNPGFKGGVPSKQMNLNPNRSMCADMSTSFRESFADFEANGMHPSNSKLNNSYSSNPPPGFENQQLLNNCGVYPGMNSMMQTLQMQNVPMMLKQLAAQGSLPNPNQIYFSNDFNMQYQCQPDLNNSQSDLNVSKMSNLNKNSKTFKPKKVNLNKSTHDAAAFGMTKNELDSSQQKLNQSMTVVAPSALKGPTHKLSQQNILADIDKASESESKKESDKSYEGGNKQDDLEQDRPSSQLAPNDAASNSSKDNDAYHSSFIMEDGEYSTSTVKFFNAKKKFGFINPNIFFHWEDLDNSMSNINKNMLRTAEKKNEITVKFQKKQYMNNHQELSTKAINIKVLSIEPKPAQQQS